MGGGSFKTSERQSLTKLCFALRLSVCELKTGWQMQSNITAATQKTAAISVINFTGNPV